MSGFSSDETDIDQFKESKSDVRGNKIQKLIMENKLLKNKLREAAKIMSRKRDFLEDVYEKMQEAVEKLNSTIGEQKEEIETLKADNKSFRLRSSRFDGETEDCEADEEFEKNYADSLAELKNKLKQEQESNRLLTEKHERYVDKLQSEWVERENVFCHYLEDKTQQYEQIQLRQQELLREQQRFKGERAHLAGRVEELEREQIVSQRNLEMAEQKIKALKGRIEEMRLGQSQMTTEYKRVITLNEGLKTDLQLIQQTQKTDLIQFDEIFAQKLGLEETIGKKNNEIQALTRKGEEARSQIYVYKQQMNIYKKDSEMEEKKRRQCEIEMQKLKECLMEQEARYQGLTYAP